MQFTQHYQQRYRMAGYELVRIKWLKQRVIVADWTYIGALNLSDIGATIVHDYESINSETIVRFFCKLRESYPLAHKLHIILDGAGYHRSDLVRDAAFVLNIELHYLPP